MKRVILILCLLFVAAMFVFADDAAVIPEVDITPASMDNMKIGETITVDGRLGECKSEIRSWSSDCYLHERYDKPWCSCKRKCTEISGI